LIFGFSTQSYEKKPKIQNFNPLFPQNKHYHFQEIRYFSKKNIKKNLVIRKIIRNFAVSKLTKQVSSLK